MEKDSKWYKAIQKLYDVAKKYGDVPVKDEDELTKIYYAVKAEAKDQDDFVTSLLVDFVHEKRRELEYDSR